MAKVSPVRDKVTVIAEIGCNHKGDINIAKEMIAVAAEYCKVGVVKFQKRSNKELIPTSIYNSPHPVPENSYGDTYGLHREHLEFTLEQHAELKKYAESKGIKYTSSVWELTSAKEIASLQPEYIKIPSASNQDRVMLDWLLDNYKGQIHVSLGMTRKDEESLIIRMFDLRHRTKDLVLYACTSGYPIKFSDVCLMEIARLKDHYYHPRLCHKLGFSGHHLGIAIDPVAVALGARFIERHFTLSRTWKGTDHAASLEPDGMRKLVRDIDAIVAALQYKKPDVLPVEEEQLRKLRCTK